MSDSYGRIKVDEIQNSDGDLLDLTTITSDEATTSASGYMSATDKTKLDGIEAGAEVNAVTSVNGSTGAVTVQGFSGNYDDLTNKPTIPTIDADTVIDANYVATDENFTTADHTKLDGIAAGAEVNAVTSVNGFTGAVTVATFSGDYGDLSNTPATVQNTFGSSEPTSPSAGDFWADTSTDPPALKSYNGTAWVSVGSAGSGVANTFSGSAPTSPSEGDFWVDTSTDPPALKSYNGTAWVSITTSPSAPVINSVTLAESDATGDRFTSESFAVTVGMLDDGTPVSQKGIKATVTASFGTFPETNAASSVTTNTTASNEGNVKIGSDSSLSPSGVHSSPHFTWVDSNGEVHVMMFRGINNDPELYGSSDNLLALSELDSGTAGDDLLSDFGVQNRAGDYINFFVRSGDSGSAVVSSLDSNSRLDKTVYVSTDAYEYELRCDSNGSSGHVIRTRKSDGNVSSTCAISNSVNQTYVIETASDRVVLITKTSGNLMQYLEYTDTMSAADDSRWSGGNNLTGFTQLSFKRAQVSSYVWHKDQLFFSTQTEIQRFAKDSSTPTVISLPTLPSGITWSTESRQILWEEPGGLLICRVQVSNDDRSEIEYLYYSSSNSGSTWVADFYPKQEPTAYEIYEEYYEPDHYVHGYRIQTQKRRYSNSSILVYKEVFLLGYQDVTVTDGADLNDLNVGDLVKVDGVLDPRYYNYIMSITDNGGGTHTLRIRGFTTVTTGDVLQAVAPTGTSSSTRYLVISAQGAVSTHQATDPGFVTQGPGLSHTLTFPATFPTGNAPDDELPSGTSIQIEVEATNSVSSDTYTSNSVTPS